MKLLLFLSLFYCGILKAQILLVGDSTVAKFPGDPSRNIHGWGVPFSKKMGSRSLQVINSAVGGSTSKSFYNNYWPAALASTKTGPVYIQFGHNDGYRAGSDYLNPAQFKLQILKYINDAQKKGLSVVLVTPPVRNQRLPNGKVDDSDLRDYANVMKELSVKHSLPLVDLMNRSKRFFESMRPEAATSFYSSTKDITHFSSKGAQILGDWVVDSVKLKKSSNFFIRSVEEAHIVE